MLSNLPEKYGTSKTIFSMKDIQVTGLINFCYYGSQVEFSLDSQNHYKCFMEAFEKIRLETYELQYSDRCAEEEITPSWDNFIKDFHDENESIEIIVESLFPNAWYEDYFYKKEKYDLFFKYSNGNSSIF